MNYGTASGATKGAAQDQAALLAYTELTRGRSRGSFINFAAPSRKIDDKVVEDRSSPSNVILTVCICFQS